MMEEEEPGADVVVSQVATCNFTEVEIEDLQAKDAALVELSAVHARTVDCVSKELKML